MKRKRMIIKAALAVVLVFGMVAVGCASKPKVEKKSDPAAPNTTEDATEAGAATATAEAALDAAQGELTAATAAEAAAKNPQEVEAARKRKQQALDALVEAGNLYNQATERVVWSEMTSIPNKNFESRGIVIFVAERGSVVTATDLMKEAKKVSADDIINVRIDTERTPEGGVMSSSGSATAIKYIGDGLNEIVITKNEKDGAKSEKIIDRKIGGAGTYGN
ncbi:hypothetical protein AGMMS49991_09320 [Spirochaetia bacterium]|nr:hypothetical protein AGMMS49991_09320 [Spirochaetia bacterium]